ncbi:MAG: 3-methyl-2-oxobutanoate hydroxymethyltransferase, partial [Thaumarchaeota archaeon]|nr:3-methyl-2-oxobutanoate hydroxymethyltransferase [Nitrososphaerota archaeon]
MVTAYDYPSAKLAEKVGVDIVLIGDSAGMVVLGYDSTTPVSMDEMIMLCKAVSRGAKRPLLVGDMPFLSYQVSIEDAVRNAGRFVKEGGVDAVKLEGGEEYESTVRAICRAGIPVMGHIGL